MIDLLTKLLECFTLDNEGHLQYAYMQDVGLNQALSPELEAALIKYKHDNNVKDILA